MSDFANRKLLGGWYPERNRSISGLVWQFSHAGRTMFSAEISRGGETIDTFQARSLEKLAEQLIAKCGPARRSMVRLGVNPAVCST